MEENAPTSPPKSRYRWVWRLCWIVLLLAFLWGAYMSLTGLPALYSPADKVRKPASAYLDKMNPPRYAIQVSKTPTNGPTAITVTTNGSKVRIEYKMPKADPVDVVGFTLHRAKSDDIVRMGDLAFKLKRIGYGWAPPGTNTQQYSTQVPGVFYDADFRQLTDAEVKQELKHSWERSINSRGSRPSYRFDMEVSGGPNKFLGASLFDARTQVELTSGTSFSENGQTHTLEIEPFLWHKASVELVVDFASDMQEEMLSLTNASFTIGVSRYHLVFAEDGFSSSYYGHGSDSSNPYVEVRLVATNSPVNPQKEQCLLIYASSPPASQTAFELEYLDASGRKIETGGGSSSSGQIMQWLKCKKADIKSIRVKKYASAHRIVLSFPYLPGPPPSNQEIENLFQVRVPLLRFNYEHDERDFIERVTQVKLHNFPYTSLPSGTYPRWLTNATPADVLETYAQLQGIASPFYVDQDDFTVRQGSLTWPMQAKTKIEKFIKKMKGP